MFRSLFLLFLLLTALEIYVLIQVGGYIGGLATILMILLTAAVGITLVRAEGIRTIMSLQGKLARGVLPDKEIIDGIMLLVGGAFLITPGFVTDAVGFALVIPFTRGIIRSAIQGAVLSTILGKVSGSASAGPFTGSGAPFEQNGPFSRGSSFDQGGPFAEKPGENPFGASSSLDTSDPFNPPGKEPPPKRPEFVDEIIEGEFKRDGLGEDDPPAKS